MEAIEDIKMYQKDRQETQSIDVLQPGFKIINNAIQQKDPVLFKEGYTLLTNSCNSCHEETDYGFNIVKIPDSPPFSNQQFELEKEK